MSALTDGTPPKPLSFQQLLDSEQVRERFSQILGNRSGAFMVSLLNVYRGNNLLAECEPTSIIRAAMLAAALDLPIDPTLAMAYIVPYYDKKAGRKLAQFQPGYKGYIQLALRTDKYQTIHVGDVYDGQDVTTDPVTGNISITGSPDGTRRIKGRIAYLKLITGFEKAIYMSNDEIDEHMKTYAAGWDRQNSAWVTARDSMARKTVLKRLLTHYGILTINWRYAQLVDDVSSDTLADELEQVQKMGGDTIPIVSLPVSKGDAPVIPGIVANAETNGAGAAIPGAAILSTNQENSTIVPKPPKGEQIIMQELGYGKS